jgi:hypothetical protein
LTPGTEPEPLLAANGKNTLTVRGGIIESVWVPGSFVDVDEARDAMRATELVCQGGPRPMLSVMTDVEISAAARYEFAKSVDVAAIAVLGSSAVDRVVAAATSRDTRYPHEFFTSREAALAWLQGFLAMDGDADTGPDAAVAGGPDNGRIAVLAPGAR